MGDRNQDIYTYTLTLQSIKMKVKFPCKMKLEYNGETISGEANQNETGKFIFNQELTLKEENCSESEQF